MPAPRIATCSIFSRRSPLPRLPTLNRRHRPKPLRRHAKGGVPTQGFAPPEPPAGYLNKEIARCFRDLPGGIFGVSSRHGAAWEGDDRQGNEGRRSSWRRSLSFRRLTARSTQGRCVPVRTHSTADIPAFPARPVVQSPGIPCALHSAGMAASGRSRAGRSSWLPCPHALRFKPFLANSKFTASSPMSHSSRLKTPRARPAAPAPPNRPSTAAVFSNRD